MLYVSTLQYNENVGFRRHNKDSFYVKFLLFLKTLVIGVITNVRKYQLNYILFGYHGCVGTQRSICEITLERQGCEEDWGIHTHYCVI